MRKKINLLDVDTFLISLQFEYCALELINLCSLPFDQEFAWFEIKIFID